jgi:hypothetical protein
MGSDSTSQTKVLQKHRIEIFCFKVQAVTMLGAVIFYHVKYDLNPELVKVV